MKYIALLLAMLLTFNAKAENPLLKEAREREWKVCEVIGFLAYETMLKRQDPNGQEFLKEFVDQSVSTGTLYMAEMYRMAYEVEMKDLDFQKKYEAQKFELKVRVGCLEHLSEPNSNSRNVGLRPSNQVQR
jgi:hypothetical protein